MKLIGTSDDGQQLLPGLDLFDYFQVERRIVRFPKHRFPERMTDNDWLIYYAVGGTKTIFACARMSGWATKLADPGHRFPHRAPVSFDETTVIRDLAFAPKLIEVSLDLEDEEKRETSHHPMTRQQFDLACKLLRRHRLSAPPSARAPLF